MPSSVSVAAATPPVKLTTQVALRAPLACGRNCTPNEQLVPGASEAPHIVVPDGGTEARNSPVAPPTAAIGGLAKLIVAPELLVKSTPTVGLVVPTCVAPNSTGFGVAAGVGADGGVGPGANGGGGGGGKAVAT